MQREDATWVIEAEQTRGRELLEEIKFIMPSRIEKVDKVSRDAVMRLKLLYIVLLDEGCDAL